MVTKFYWHNTISTTTGLPTTEQSSQTTVASGIGEPQNQTLEMDTVKGTSQVNGSYSTSATSIMFLGRWVSDIIGQTNIQANTWTVSYGYQDTNGGDGPFYFNVYVWRPSNSSKVGTIFDGSINKSVTNTAKRTFVTTFTGQAVSGLQTNDVICMEFLVKLGGGGFFGATKRQYLDGTTEATADNQSFTSIASYISTPENITFGPITSITASVTAKTLANKFITKDGIS